MTLKQSSPSQIQHRIPETIRIRMASFILPLRESTILETRMVATLFPMIAQMPI